MIAKLEGHVAIVAVSVICLAAIEIVALLHNIDSFILGTVVAAITAITTSAFERRRRRR